jgi:hypothetical protein
MMSRAAVSPSIPYVNEYIKNLADFILLPKIFEPGQELSRLLLHARTGFQTLNRVKEKPWKSSTKSQNISAIPETFVRNIIFILPFFFIMYKELEKYFSKLAS